MPTAAVQQWEDRFRDLARSNGWSFEIEVHPDGGSPRAVRHFPDFQQVLTLAVGGPNVNAVIGGLVIPALDQTRQDLFGGYYDPRTDHPMLYECTRVSWPRGETLPEIAALDEAFTSLAGLISRVEKPGTIGPILADRKSRHPGDIRSLSWIALNRLAWGEEEARRLIDEELAQLRRWSVGNLVEAVVLKLLRSKARQRDFQRLEVAKQRLANITTVVDPQRYQFPILRAVRNDVGEVDSALPSRGGSAASMGTESTPSECSARVSDEIAAHKFSSRHRKQLEESSLCGCFHCLATFPSTAIDEWVDEDETELGQTAMCPRCGIDSVIGSAAGFPLTREFLERMQRHWFGTSSDFYGSVDLPEVTIAVSILENAGWTVRKSGWHEFEIQGNDYEIYIESCAPVLVHGLADHVDELVRKLAKAFGDAGVRYSFEVHEPSGEPKEIVTSERS